MPYRNADNPHGDSSFLFLQYKPNKPTDTVIDRGYRPLAPGTPFWNSPDILAAPADALGNVTAGTPVTLSAIVHNGGLLEAVGVAVDFWWFDPTLAFSPSIPNAHLGTKIVNIPANNYRQVVCPNVWVPHVVNHGHECLIAHCNASSEGTDGLKFPFAAALDRHVGQRNLTVYPNLPGQALALSVGNPFRTPQAFEVRFASTLVSADMAAMRALDMGSVRNLLTSVSPGSEPDPRFQMHAIDITSREMGVRLGNMRKIKRYGCCAGGVDRAAHLKPRARANPDFDSGKLGRSLAGFSLKPDEVRQVTLEFPPTDVGESHFMVHRITQVMEGFDVGGYTAVIVPSRFGDRRSDRHVSNSTPVVARVDARSFDDR